MLSQKLYKSLILAFSLTLGLASLQSCAAPGTVANEGVSQQNRQNQNQISGEMVLPYEAEAEMRVQSRIEGDAFFRLSAQVDGEPVNLNIQSSRVGNGQTYVQYTMNGLPLLQADQVYTVEVFTPENEPFLGAVLDIEERPDLRLDLDVDSTAVLIAARRESNDRYLVDLSPAEVRVIRRDPELVKVRANVRSVLRDVGSLTTGILETVFDGVAKILDRV